MGLLSDIEKRREKEKLRGKAKLKSAKTRARRTTTPPARMRALQSISAMARREDLSPRQFGTLGAVGGAAGTVGHTAFHFGAGAWTVVDRYRQLRTIPEETLRSLEARNVDETAAVLLRDGVPVAQVSTSRANGEMVSYGWKKTSGGSLVQVGRAKISRAKKWLKDDELMLSLNFALVNAGGGRAEGFSSVK